MGDLIGFETASIEQQRDNWMETARQHAINEEYQRSKRFEMLRWLRDSADSSEGHMPQWILDDFKLLDDDGQ